MKRISTDAEYLDSGKVVIDADGIPADLGYRGTGSPEGKVSAPVGSVYTDTAATNGAIRWVKTSGTGTTRWRVQYGDTGWRNVSHLMPSGWGGTILILRSQNRVTITGTNLRPATTGTTSLFSIPDGFKPSTTTLSLGIEGSSFRPVYVFNYAPFNFQFRDVASTDSWMHFTIEYVCHDAWPTTLPGTPA